MNKIVEKIAIMTVKMNLSNLENHIFKGSNFRDMVRNFNLMKQHKHTLQLTNLSQKDPEWIQA